MNNDFSSSEHFFHHTYLSIINGDLDDAKSYFYSLQKSLKDNNSLFDIFTSSQKNMMKKFKTILNEPDLSPTLFSINPVNISTNNSLTLKLDRELKLEKDLKEFLISKWKELAPLFSIPIWLWDIERDVGNGFVDLVFGTEDRKIMIPVELKLNKFDYVDSQIRKYLNYYYKRFHYKQWESVQGVVISPVFSDFCLRELKKLDVTPIKYVVSGANIIFQKVGSTPNTN